jgi:paraquat-inducible protein B
MSKHASPTAVGTFIVCALALLLAGVLLLGGGRYFHRRSHVIVYFDSSVEGLRIGAPVKFRGIELGTVKDLRINMTGAISDPRHIRIPALLEIDEDRLRTQGLRRVNLDDKKQVEELVKLGLRARLETESLVTGVRFVALDIRPDTPVVLSHDVKYPEIPSVPSMRERVTDKAEELLAKLGDVDLVGLVDSARTTIDDTDKLLSAPALTRAVSRLDDITSNLAQSTRDLTPTIAQLKDTAAATRRTVGPNGLIASRLDSTLQEIEQAARSLRRLADRLNRDPGAILRGGKE